MAKNKHMTIRKFAKLAEKRGRLGDTELVHINKDEERLLEKYSGKRKLSRNPVTGLKEAFPWFLVAAGVKAVAKGVGAHNKRKQSDKTARAQRQLAQRRLQMQIQALEKTKQMGPHEMQAFESMKSGAEQGTMDVEALTAGVSQPAMQAGQAQTAQAQQQITKQGLEGSIIAQDVASQIGSDVRATIATQARDIAMANEATKERARQRLEDARFSRAEKLRNIAFQQAGLRGESDLQNMIQAIRQQEAKGAQLASTIQAGGDFLATAAGGGQDTEWLRTGSSNNGTEYDPDKKDN